MTARDLDLRACERCGGWADPDHTAEECDGIVAAHEQPSAEAQLDALRAIVAALLPYEFGNSHSHARMGVWDPDNRPPARNAPCRRCHAFADAREALGLPRWPSPEEHRRASCRYPDDRSGDVCEHGETCGCGAALRTLLGANR